MITKRSIICLLYFKQDKTTVKINAVAMKMDSGNTYDLFEHCNRRTNKEATVVLEWVISSENRNHYLNCTTSKARQNGIIRTGNKSQGKATVELGST